MTKDDQQAMDQTLDALRTLGPTKLHSLSADLMQHTAHPTASDPRGLILLARVAYVLACEDQRG